MIRKGKFEGFGCYCKTGLLNTLIKLRPKVCLKIGTYKGGTTRVFQHYFEKYEPHGIRVTADIAKYRDLSNRYVTQVMVYPHTANIADYHEVNETQMLTYSQSQIANSVDLNYKILQEALDEIQAGYFDSCFIHGDHQEISLLRDLEICSRLSRRPHYYLLDDTKEGLHESSAVYQNELSLAYKHYDFDDWMPHIFVGMSLISER